MVKKKKCEKESTIIHFLCVFIKLTLLGVSFPYAAKAYSYSLIQQFNLLEFIYKILIISYKDTYLKIDI